MEFHKYKNYVYFWKKTDYKYFRLNFYLTNFYNYQCFILLKVEEINLNNHLMLLLECQQIFG